MTVLSRQKILIIRSSALGDIVFASPFAAALRRTYPDAFIAWLVEPGIDELLQENPYIDELVIWPKKDWQRLLKKGRWIQLAKAMRAYARQLQGYQFDWAIEMQSLLKGGILARMTGAPRRTGLGSTEGSQYLMTEVIPKGGDIARVSSEYLYLAEQLGLDAGDFIPELFLPKAAVASVQGILQEYGLNAGGYAVLAPFTTRPQKHWFEEHWQELIHLLKERWNITSVVLGGSANQNAAERIIAKTPGTIHLAGKTSIMESAALVKYAGFLVGVDTGVTHMSIAVNTPAVMLFGSTCPYTKTCREHAHVLWLGMSCSPCKRNPICDGTFPCMRYITAEKVVEELEKVVKLSEINRVGQEILQ